TRFMQKELSILNPFLDQPLMAGRIGEHALAVTVLVIGDRTCFEAARRDRVVHRRARVRHENSDYHAGGFQSFRAQMTAWRNLLVQMKKRSSDRHFRNMNRSIRVAPSP